MVAGFLRRIAQELRDGFLAYGAAMSPVAVPVGPVGPGGSGAEEEAVVLAALRILDDAAGPAGSMWYPDDGPDAMLSVEDYLRRIAG